MAKLVTDHMAESGTHILRRCVPEALEKTSGGRVMVTWKEFEGGLKRDEFDTVLLAVGRHH